MSHLLTKAFFVQCADLFKKYDAVFFKPELIGKDINMGGKLTFIGPACYGCGNDGRAVLIAHIVLYNEYGTDTALL